ncbi:Cupredoxin [Lactarius hatsudake]|nr:Cupredoxin [Lactarius hatsudake]
MGLRSLVVVLAAISGRVRASIGPSIELPIVNALVAPDGFLRSATLAGNTFPDPLIRANKVQDNNYVDGSTFVTQCPIIPGESFTYQFQTSEQSGTYWYHAHYKVQYCDGLRGLLVIYDLNDPHVSLYDVDNEDTIITLADWYHYVSLQAPADHNAERCKSLPRPTGEPLAVIVVKGQRLVQCSTLGMRCDLMLLPWPMRRPH